MKTPSPFQYPMVIKQVNDLLTVSVPDLEITVTEAIKDDHISLANRLTSIAARRVIEKLRQMELIGKQPIRRPSFIRDNLQTENNESLSTADAAAFLSISQATLKRWESRGIIHASKSAGGHRAFDFSELQRVLAHMKSGQRAPEPMA